MEFNGKCRLNTSLIVAAVFGQIEAARLLIDKGWQLCAESICLHK